MLDDMQQAEMLNLLQTQVNEFPNLLAAYQHIEPNILKAFNASRMSLFQRRLQQQDLVARYKTGCHKPAVYCWIRGNVATSHYHK
jgi:hypothetical protein